MHAGVPCPMQASRQNLLAPGPPEAAYAGAWAERAGGAAHPEIGLRLLSTFCKKTSLWSGCQAPCLSAVSFEKCHPAKPRLLHARLRLSGDAHFLAPHVEDAPWDLMQPAVGSTIESTGTGCSTAAMTSERRADETQVVTGCARGPDKGSRLGLGTLGAAHSPDKTVPSRSGLGGRAPSRSGFFGGGGVRAAVACAQPPSRLCAEAPGRRRAPLLASNSWHIVYHTKALRRSVVSTSALQIGAW